MTIMIIMSSKPNRILGEDEASYDPSVGVSLHLRPGRDYGFRR